MGSATSIPAWGAPDLDDSDQIPRCRKLVDYVYANREGIKNYRLVPLASSGPMEEAIDILASLPPSGSQIEFD